MEGLLILVGIYVLEIVIKKLAVNKSKKQSEQQQLPDEEPEQDSGQARSPRSLQDLIRQFEEAQQESSQGTYVPPTPPVEEDDAEELPVVTPANPGEYTFEEIAESVIQWEYVSADLLQEAFGFSSSVAQQVLEELQAKRIIGRDMGEGDCDLLIHDRVELGNHFKRLRLEAEELRLQQAREAELQRLREEKARQQKNLAEQAERIRQEQEQEGIANEASNSIAQPCLAGADHRAHSRSFDKSEIRRGFIWAKVLEEPRFKKHWNPRTR